MNKHSIKVPRLYKVSAQVAKEVSEGIGSIKSLVYEKQKKHPNIKAIYALVATLFQKTDELDILLKRSQILVKEPRFDTWLAKILIVELIWGKKRLPGQSKPENTVRAYEQIFKAHLSDELSQEVDSKENDGKPRYVRVNTLLTSLNEAIDGFRDDDWILSKFLDKEDYGGYLERIKSLNKDEFMIDIHVPNLLVFPPKTQFYNHPAYKNGSILLQDKASCLPVHILGPPLGSTVLDMCAAPGMKTTHLAAVLNDQGTVYATERNPKRFETLSKIVATSGAKCIKTFNKDVLDCTKDDFPGVEYILVDPSCSGTGMSDRHQENEITESRMANLTGFQIKILRHALTKFPDAKRVVYSTCSILKEENEDVIRQVLETNYNFKLVPANKFVGNAWLNFGSCEFGDLGNYCLYAKPNVDHTNGFFVAVFERVKDGEENQFFNTRIFNFKKHVQANEKWKEKKQKKFDNPVQKEALHKPSYDKDRQSEEDYENEKKESEADITAVADVQKIKKEKRKHDTVYSDSGEDPTTIREQFIEDEGELKKKKKKRVKEVENIGDIINLNSGNSHEKKKKKNKVEKDIDELVDAQIAKKEKHEDGCFNQQIIDLDQMPFKNKKKKKHEIVDEDECFNQQIIDNDQKPFKKKKKHGIIDEDECLNEQIIDSDPKPFKKKKKKNQHEIVDECSIQQIIDDEQKPTKKKKSKKDHPNIST